MKEMRSCWLWGHSICKVSTVTFRLWKADSIALSALQVMSHLYKPCEHDWRHLVPWVMPSIHENYIAKVHSITFFYKNCFGFFSSSKKKVKCFYFSYFGISLFDFVSGLHSFLVFWVSVSCMQMFRLNQMIFESPG